MSRLIPLTSPARPLVMGILNVTPDSFSDGGAFLSPDDAIRHATQMIADGADIIDIGGASTRPPGKSYGKGASQVSESDELGRVLPVIRGLRAVHGKVLITIDTTKSRVAKAAIEAGADIINDVSAATDDPEMLPTAANLNVPIILMHGYGPTFNKPIEECNYTDVVRDVRDYLTERIAAAKQAGIPQIIADVGIGFAKRFEDNMRLLRHLEEMKTLGVPMLLGASRKSSIGRAMAGAGDVPPPNDRLPGSLAVVCYAAQHGVAILRVHDVRETVEALRTISAISNA